MSSLGNISKARKDETRTNDSGLKGRRTVRIKALSSSGFSVVRPQLREKRVSSLEGSERLRSPSRSLAGAFSAHVRLSWCQAGPPSRLHCRGGSAEPVLSHKIRSRFQRRQPRTAVVQLNPNRVAGGDHTDRQPRSNQRHRPLRFPTAPKRRTRPDLDPKAGSAVQGDVVLKLLHHNRPRVPTCPASTSAPRPRTRFPPSGMDLRPPGFPPSRRHLLHQLTVSYSTLWRVQFWRLTHELGLGNSGAHRKVTCVPHSRMN